MPMVKKDEDKIISVNQVYFPCYQQAYIVLCEK